MLANACQKIKNIVIVNIGLWFDIHTSSAARVLHLSSLLKFIHLTDVLILNVAFVPVVWGRMYGLVEGEK